jgi:hypothetical protein
MALTTKRFQTSEQALKEVVKIRKIIYPSEKNHKLYNEYFMLFKEINKKLYSVYVKHKSIKYLRNIEEKEILRNL